MHKIQWTDVSQANYITVIYTAMQCTYLVLSQWVAYLWEGEGQSLPTQPPNYQKLMVPYLNFFKAWCQFLFTLNFYLKPSNEIQ